MGRNSATIKYAIGSLFGNAFPMYVFGSGILTTGQFLLGLVRTQSIEGAISVALNYYIAKLTPFPLNEFLTTSGFQEVAINIGAALAVGVVTASFLYRKNRY